jgi:AraC-like DNA-binding protein
VSGQILEASHESPYIGIWIDFNSDEIAEVALLSKMDLKPKKGSRNPGAFVGKADVNLLDILTRMLNLNGTTADPSFLSNLYKQELIYNLLNGSWGYLYAQQVHLFQQATGLRNTITWIKENYAKPFTIEELAKENNMSASSLHHKFKALTTMGPLQYQKHLRLLEARRLMLNESLDSIEAALEVGYESPSQFNREYKRLFGQPPLRDIKSVHTQLAAKD